MKAAAPVGWAAFLFKGDSLTKAEAIKTELRSDLAEKLSATDEFFYRSNSLWQCQRRLCVVLSDIPERILHPIQK